MELVLINEGKRGGYWAPLIVEIVRLEILPTRAVKDEVFTVCVVEREVAKSLPVATLLRIVKLFACISPATYMPYV
jgi:hypothetical protein